MRTQKKWLGEVKNAKGLTVRELQRLLDNAHPDAVVWLDDPWGKVVKASLDAFPAVMDNAPFVKFELEKD
jgi:hypothetical protein